MAIDSDKYDTSPSLLKTSFTAKKEEWKIFKTLCKKNNSDASKELRKFISDYNRRYSNSARKDLTSKII